MCLPIATGVCVGGGGGGGGAYTQCDESFRCRSMGDVSIVDFFFL